MKITGVLVNYYFSCKRQLWLFANKVTMEKTSELVTIGKLIEFFYKESRGYEKNIIIDETISPDHLKKENENVIVLEIKKSSRLRIAAVWQLKYYLWYLEQKGLKVKGRLVIPEENIEEFVELTEDDKIKLKKIIEEIKEIVKKDKPPKVPKMRRCKYCSYKLICWKEEFM